MLFVSVEKWFDVLPGNNFFRTIRHLPVHLPSALIVRESCGR
jgi:hypothetical protein